MLDVYRTEFGSYPKTYYESAIRQGRILVSDKVVDLEYVIKGGDILTHTVHVSLRKNSMLAPIPPLNITYSSNLIQFSSLSVGQN